ncbi:OmpW family outer membrane protein [Methylobacterium sp. 77]|uniref:OmpW/AlkL family protein n=1 Tax=Methylobacterium sp. 77 TaxID=1101192 RepID=UPI0003653C7C|nr:OmpW family outer membrane protein [Methylobacterium sp. 77]
MAADRLGLAALALAMATSVCLGAEDILPVGAPLAPREGFAAGDVLVRARIIGMVAVDERSRIDLIGATAGLPTMILPDADVTYFLTGNLAVAGQAGIIRTKPVTKGSLAGDIPTGAIRSFGASAAIQYHAFSGRPLKPYAGLGFSLPLPLRTEPAGGLVTAFSVDPIAGLLLQAGFDHHLGGNRYANAEVKKICLPRYTLGKAGIGATVEVNTVIVGGGIGYCF